MEAKIVITPGDGIGPEVTAEAVKVLNAIGDKFGIVSFFPSKKLAAVPLMRMEPLLPMKH